MVEELKGALVPGQAVRDYLVSPILRAVPGEPVQYKPITDEVRESTGAYLRKIIKQPFFRNLGLEQEYSYDNPPTFNVTDIGVVSRESHTRGGIATIFGLRTDIELDLPTGKKTCQVILTPSTAAGHMLDYENLTADKMTVEEWQTHTW